MTTELHVKLGFARGDTVLCKSGTEVFHHQRRLCFILERNIDIQLAECTSEKREIKGKRRRSRGSSLPHPSRCDARLRRSRPATRRVRADPCVLVRICRDVRDELLRRERQEAFSVCQHISYIIYIKKGGVGWSGGGQELAEQKRTMGDGRTIASLHIRNLLSGGNNPLLHQVSIYIIPRSMSDPPKGPKGRNRSKTDSPKARNHPTSARTQRESCLFVLPLPAASCCRPGWTAEKTRKTTTAHLPPSRNPAPAGSELMTSKMKLKRRRRRRLRLLKGPQTQIVWCSLAFER